MKKWMSCILIVFSWTMNAQEEALFDNATADYNEGKYEAAAKKYEEILQNGKHSAALYFNLGNANYKLNRIAPSIYYYEKALLLDPNDPEIKNNLAFARNMTLDDVEALPQAGLTRFLGRLTGLMTFDQWAYYAIVCQPEAAGFYHQLRIPVPFASCPAFRLYTV